MATRLYEVLEFTNVPPGVTSLPHHINLDGRSVPPDFAIFQPTGTITAVSVTSTDVTFTNSSPGNIDCQVTLERLHSILRAFGADQTVDLIPQPVILIVSGSGGGGGSTNQNFLYISPGTELDPTDFRVPLPAPRAALGYFVDGQPAGVTALFAMDLPDNALDRTLVDFRVILTAAIQAGDTLQFSVYDP
jgi:hypothetical protein